MLADCNDWTQKLLHRSSVVDLLHWRLEKYPVKLRPGLRGRNKWSLKEKSRIPIFWKEIFNRIIERSSYLATELEISWAPPPICRSWLTRPTLYCKRAYLVRDHSVDCVYLTCVSSFLINSTLGIPYSQQCSNTRVAVNFVWLKAYSCAFQIFFLFSWGFRPTVEGHVPPKKAFSANSSHTLTPRGMKISDLSGIVPPAYTLWTLRCPYTIKMNREPTEQRELRSFQCVLPESFLERLTWSAYLALLKLLSQSVDLASCK